MSNYRRHFRAHDIVFVTLVTAGRAPWLGDPGQKELLLSVMAGTAKHKDIRNIAHVVLDDHLHWMFDSRRSDVPRVINGIKQGMIFARKRLGLSWKRLWQPRYFDHVIRDDHDLRRHLEYIHFNPVRHGYVGVAREYPWSSFQQWVLRGVHDTDWGVSDSSVVHAMDRE